MDAAPPTPSPDPPPRFSWPMRLFLGFLVFNIVGHSFLVLLPIKDWLDELKLNRFPEPGLPTRAEIAELSKLDPAERERRKAANGESHSVAERVFRSADGVWEFWKPWPSRETRKHIKDWKDGGKFAACWLTTRLGFLNNLVHTPQRWTMFSPYVNKGELLVRLRLIYEDGSVRHERTIADPVDPTAFDSFRFLSEKHLQYATTLDDDYQARLGLSNMMAHRYPTNEAGSPLVKIRMVKVRYTYPAPGEDWAAKMKEQIERPGEEKNAPFWEYDVKSRSGRRLD